MENKEMEMKKILTILVIFASLSCIFASAEASECHEVSYANLPVQATERSVARSVERLYIQTFPEKTVYKAFDKLDTRGMTLRAVYDDGSEQTVTAADMRLTYQRGDCFRYGDSAVTITYGGRSIDLPITVERISYDLSALSPENFTVEYNGKNQSYTSVLPQIVGLDGIPLTIRVVGGGSEVGSYSVTLDFSTDSRDYLTPNSRIVTMTVLPAQTEIIWTDTSFVYDGKSKIPTAYYTDVTGMIIYPTVFGAATEAGSSYIATASVSDPNYSFKNTSCSYEIKKADYDLSNAEWSEAEFSYDGTEKRVYLSGLPDGVSIVGYKNDRARDVGNYTASATLSWDTRNYNAPTSLSHMWEIKPSEYDMSGVRFLPAETSYDGQIHYPTLDGTMPTGADGIRLEYSFSAGALHVDEGIVEVTISFSTKSKNYLTPESHYSTVRIIPKGIYVTWSGAELSYTGELIKPAATSPECKISVIGGGVSVGSYKVEAVAENSDFLVENKDFDFKIIKSYNAWTKTPSSKPCFESREPGGFGESKFGNITYRYFSDAQCKNEIPIPRAAGIYYAIAEVAETENYYSLTSTPFAFEIQKVVLVDIGVDINKSKIKVFDRLAPSDFSAYLLYNDGSKTPIESSLVKVIYNSSDCFSLSDDSVSFAYKDFTHTKEIVVHLADYDLSRVVWENTVQYYDGTPKAPTLAGLPDGVRVVEYIATGAVDAGVYTVTALLEYDKVNYSEPEIPACSFTINKRRVAIPTITATYNGKPISAVSDSSLYTIESAPSFTEAGEYAITVRLTDSKNYTFGESGDKCTAVFKILPKAITLTAPDVVLHLWERAGEGEYIINESDIIPGDAVTLSQYESGGFIRFRSDNPNYVISQSGGEIIRLPYPSAKGMISLLLYIILVLALSAGLLLAYRYRHRIKNAMAIVRCRWNNRSISISPPKVERRIITESKIKQDTCEPVIANEEPPTKEEPEPSEEEETEPEIELEPECYPEEELECLETLEGFGVDVERADELITDSLAKNLVRKDGGVIYTDGSSKGIINVDTLSEHFSSGEKIDINSLKNKSLIPYDTAYIKVLARGIIDKPLTVYANDFSLSAVKMIALTGGEAIKTVTLKSKDKNN